jgi:hypothetical protein
MLGFMKKHVAEKQCETHTLSNQDTGQWIKYLNERETAGAKMRVKDAEAAGQQEQEHTRKAENV